MTDAEDGVWFRPFPALESQYKIAWTEKGSHNGWLVLDRNNNGKIDDLGELFGNETPQPAVAAAERNGFAALAVYDQIDRGGNEDGWISSEDAIYSKLRIWVDHNHDGISQPGELHTLGSVGIAAISLHATESRRKDANGNLFRYRSTIRDAAGGEASKVIYDVFLRLGEERTLTPGSGWPEESAEVGFRPSQQTTNQQTGGPERR